MDQDRRIREGDSIIIRRGEILKHVKVTLNKTQRVGSGLHVPLAQLIGHVFGSSFEVKDGKLTKIEAAVIDSKGEEMISNEEGGDNRGIIDDQLSQRLDRDDITAMKERGETGEKIIEQLVQNSSTFQERSNFSKAKYVKKKSKKYMTNFVAEYPSARLICQLLANEQYGKAMNLQVHTLGQILAWANIRFGAKVLVFESTQSFLTGAIMERVGKGGHVVQLYPGAYPVRTLLEDFNYTAELKSNVLHGYPLEKMIFLEKPNLDVDLLDTKGDFKEDNKPIEPVNNADCPEQKPEDNSQIETLSESLAQKSEQPRVGTKRKHLSRAGKDHSDVNECLKEQRKKKEEEETKALDFLREKNFDCLVIASRYHPKDCLLTLLKYLPPSRPFVVFCQSKEPLMECYIHLKSLQVAVNIVLSTTWFRRIQSLPGRTHPDVRSSNRGGYILHGMTVKTNDEK